MEDPDVKKKLAKVPDVDKTGEPIWKIADAGSRNIPPQSARRKKTETMGNNQDEKDEDPE